MLVSGFLKITTKVSMVQLSYIQIDSGASCTLRMQYTLLTVTSRLKGPLSMLPHLGFVRFQCIWQSIYHWKEDFLHFLLISVCFNKIFVLKYVFHHANYAKISIFCQKRGVSWIFRWWNAPTPDQILKCSLGLCRR